MKAARAKRRIERVTQSPMNPVRWCLDLECGHEKWVTQRGRPSKESLTTGANGEQFSGPRYVVCPTCDVS